MVVDWDISFSRHRGITVCPYIRDTFCLFDLYCRFFDLSTFQHTDSNVNTSGLAHCHANCPFCVLCNASVLCGDIGHTVSF